MLIIFLPFLQLLADPPTSLTIQLLVFSLKKLKQSN